MKEPVLDYVLRLGRLLAATIGLWVAAQATLLLSPEAGTLVFLGAGVAGLCLLLIAILGRKETKG